LVNDLLNRAGAKEQAVAPEADTGISVQLRLTVGACQVDAMVAQSYSGTGLLVLDVTKIPASMLLYGSRIRNRLPGGPTALIGSLGQMEVSVTGNIVANEISPETADDRTTRSLVLINGSTTLSAPPVAIVGNVFIDQVTLPGRPTTNPALPAWETLNTVINY
jgi:hypothetical protein